MKIRLSICTLVAMLVATNVAHAQPAAGGTVPVTADNYPRAESDLYFGSM